MRGRMQFFPPLQLQGRGTTRRVVEGLLSVKEGPSAMLRMVPLPRNSGGGFGADRAGFIQSGHLP